MKVLTGAWQRDWIRRHSGPSDASIVVRYVQTPSVFADVRIRRDRAIPATAAAFADLTDEQLAALAEQNGFAGVTTLDGDRATWHHEIDFQPTDGAPDVGRLEPVDGGYLLEHALDGAYVESWSRLAPDTGGYLAIQVMRGGRVEQMLAVAGDHFAYARARATPLPPGDSLRELIARTHPSRDVLIGYLDCELSAGTTRGWQIEHSTLPWREGTRLALADQIAIDATGTLAPRAPAADEVWRVAVNTLSAATLRALLAR